MRVAEEGRVGREENSWLVMGAFSSRPATWKAPQTQKILSAETPPSMACWITRFMYASRTRVSAVRQGLSWAASRSWLPNVFPASWYSAKCSICSKFRSQKVSWSSPVRVSSRW